MAARGNALQVGQTVHVEELDYGFRLTVLDQSQAWLRRRGPAGGRYAGLPYCGAL
jgi:hypothetical protein